MSNFFKLLHPRPVVLVCSISKKDKPNIMACSWITPVSEEPPLIALALWREGYTHSLIEETKEFTINVPSASLLKQVWIAGTKSGRKVDKITLTKLKLVPAKKVKPPVIEECMGHLECRLLSSMKAGECNIYVGEVVEAYADESLFKKGVWTEDANILLHSGGKFFTTPKASFKVR
jgi:flavin reductase (DIM6/NTAB) family NADH-FMN oxidoreductase RutF